MQGISRTTIHSITLASRLVNRTFYLQEANGIGENPQPLCNSVGFVYHRWLRMAAEAPGHSFWGISHLPSVGGAVIIRWMLLENPCPTDRRRRACLCWQEKEPSASLWAGLPRHVLEVRWIFQQHPVVIRSCYLVDGDVARVTSSSLLYFQEQS